MGKIQQVCAATNKAKDKLKQQKKYYSGIVSALETKITAMVIHACKQASLMINT